MLAQLKQVHPLEVQKLWQVGKRGDQVFDQGQRILEPPGLRMPHDPVDAALQRVARVIVQPVMCRHKPLDRAGICAGQN